MRRTTWTLLAMLGCGCNGPAAAGAAHDAGTSSYTLLDAEPFGLNDAFLAGFLGGLDVTALDTAQAFLEQRCDLIVAVGARWARGPSPFGLVWPVIEPSPGVRDFSHADQGLAVAAARGVTWIAGIDPYPAWEQIAGQPPVPYSNADQFADYLNAVLERYDGDGVDDMPGLKAPLRFFELGNEEMLVPAFAEDVDRYVEFLKLGYRLVKQHVPDAVVLIGGLAGGGDDYATRSRPYLESVLARGGGDSFDVLSFHSYVYDDGALAAQVDGYRELMRRFGYDKPLWLTETGISSEPTGPEPWRQGTLEVQAQWVIKATVSALERGVAKVIWHSLTDTDPAAPFGLVAPDGVRKPAYYTYRLMTAQLGSMRQVRELPIGDGARAFEFSGNGSVIVAWSRRGNYNADLSRWMGGNATVTRAIVEPGRMEPVVATVPASALSLDETPVFVRAAAP